MEEGDVAAMARAMLRLGTEPELAVRLGGAGAERIRREFSIEKSIGNLWRIIQMAIRTRAQHQRKA